MDKIILKLFNGMKWGVKKKKKPSFIKQMLDNPEEFKLEAYLENDEMIIKIKRREVQK